MSANVWTRPLPRNLATLEDRFTTPDPGLELMVNALPVDEREIIRLHFGLGVPKRSIRQLGDQWGIPRARLHATLKRALAKLGNAR
jgi:DNA-directed RNA polymerase sigma subunit (sigma70/sigma32)